MFGLFKKKGEKKEVASYVNPYQPEDRVELIWDFYCASGQLFRILDEHREQQKQTENVDFDICDIFIEKGRQGYVVKTLLDSVVVRLDGFPFSIIVVEAGIKKAPPQSVPVV